MTCGLVHASYSLPKWQAVKLTFFNLRPEFINSALFLIYFIIFLKLVVIVISNGNGALKVVLLLLFGKAAVLLSSTIQRMQVVRSQA